MTILSNDAELKVVRQANQAYDPGLLLDRLISRLHLTNDAQLARVLRVDKRLLFGIRGGQLPISGSMLIYMQEATGLGVDKLRLMLNDRRKTSRMTR